MDNLSSQYNAYHLNNYLIELNHAWKKKYQNKRIQKPELVEAICNMQMNLLVDKHLVDVLILDRNSQFELNYKNYYDWFNCLKKMDDHENDIAHPIMLNKEGYSFTNAIKNTITAINGPRLDHAVWSRNLVETLILFLGVSVPELSELINRISLFNGYASYGFYIFRGGLDTLCGVKHLIGNEKYDEHGLTLADRLAFQSEQRYQRIINDICLWAPVNFLTFHYLNGSGTFGLIGNLLTVALLLGDLSLTYVVYQHKKKQFQQIELEVQHMLLEKKIKSQDIEFYLKGLHQAHEQDLEKIRYTMYYQISLVIAFSILLMNSTPCLLGGAISIFLLQILFNEKDLYLDLKNAKRGSPEANVLKFQMSMKLLEHVLLPSIFIFAGLVVMPMLTNPSAWLVFLGCSIFSGLVLKTSDEICKAYERTQMSSMRIAV